MVSSRMAKVLALLDAPPGPGSWGLSPTAAAAACEVLGVDGISAGVGTGLQGAALVWSGDEVGSALEDRQFTLGEGPGPDAILSGAPVLVPDLADTGDRWPGFAGTAAELGVRAVFAFPLRIGAISIGVLVAHRATPGSLTLERLSDALALADVVAGTLLERQSANGVAGRMPAGWAGPETYRAEVHQATGMISVQLDVPLAEALTRLRAHAWAEGRLVGDVAADVVARRLRFDEPTL